MEGKIQIPEEFNIDHQFDAYLKLIKLDKRKMQPFQLKEMRRAFYGAWGMQLILQRDRLAEHNENHACQILDDMLNQVAVFWNKEIVPGIFNQN